MFASLLLATAPAYAADSAIFDRIELADDLAITSLGIISDTRCVDAEFCFEEERLVVSAVIEYRGFESEVAVEMGEPILLEEGTLTLVATATPASDSGAIQLRKYRLDFAFEPYADE